MWGGMCHFYFMSTAMDSWSGFRVHTVIFHHASIHPNSQPVFISRSNAASPSLSFASFCVHVCKPGNLATTTTTNRRAQERKKEVEKRWERKGEKQRERKGWMKRKLITRKQMAPQFTVAPQGPGGTTLCTSGLPAPQRGVGRLNMTLCVCTFVC